MSEDYVGGLLSPSGVRAKAQRRKIGTINTEFDFIFPLY